MKGAANRRVILEILRPEVRGEKGEKKRRHAKGLDKGFHRRGLTDEWKKQRR
jgi:hypothetical protein